MLNSCHRIGFVSMRFDGTDGVSLETEKWAAVLDRMGHASFYLAGESDRASEHSHVVPEANFHHPEIEAIESTAFDDSWWYRSADRFALADTVTGVPAILYHARPPATSRRVQELKDYLKEQIYVFVRDFGIDLLIVENALAIPLNLPLGLALTEFIAETGFPTIAHHHDFFWERKRFLVNCVWDYLGTAFPPSLPSIRHVVINSSGSHQLSLRRGVSSMLIPNVMDFDSPPPPDDDYTRNIHFDLGLSPGERLVLQPTRVVQRKGIEHAIELVKELRLNARLVISHASGDEGDTYEQRVRRYAALLDVPTAFVSDVIAERRGLTADGRRIYALGDVYRHADLVTYPSTIEGFGNAFLEAIYYRRPIVVNNYSIFATDIRPKGFRVIEFDSFITEETVARARQVILDPSLAPAMAEHNYRLARQHYSYSMLERRLRTLIADLFGEEDQPACEG
jgi:mannosylglucosylglycerate synthase